MAPIAVDEHKHASNGTELKPTAKEFYPPGSSDSSRYHASSSEDAMTSEATFAAHNYHPLPIVFSRAKGCSVWDPVRKSDADHVRRSTLLTML